MKSYKKYSWVISAVSACVIAIASLDATQVINIFPEYANQINFILMLCGILAPIIMQEKRVYRAEELKEEQVKEELLGNPTDPLSEDPVIAYEEGA